jgi:thiamine kinase-like enzyme
LDSLNPALCLCRSDARFANVIARPDGRLGLVDWEDSGLRDPARDLADVITHANQEDLLSWEEWQPLIQPYLAGRRAVDPGLAHRMHLYLALFPLFWLSLLQHLGVQRAEAGTLAGWKSNEVDPQTRMRRYLARAIAWPNMNFEHELTAINDMVFLL